MQCSRATQEQLPGRNLISTSIYLNALIGMRRARVIDSSTWWRAIRGSYAACGNDVARESVCRVG